MVLLTPVTLTILHQMLRQWKNKGQGTNLRKVAFLVFVKSFDTDNADITTSKVINNSLERISEFSNSLKQKLIALGQVGTMKYCNVFSLGC